MLTNKLFVRLMHRISRRWLPASKRMAGLYYTYLLNNPEPELRYLTQLLSQYRTAVDVGANVGYWTYKLAGLFEQVISVELNEDCYRYIEDAQLPNVWLLKHGLSDRDREVPFYLPVLAGGFVNHGWGTVEKQRSEQLFDQMQERTYPVKPLDAYRLTAVDFIKIDVEGHELAVIDGAIETIRCHRPVLLIEASPATLEPLSQQLEPLGYRRFTLAELIGKKGSEGNYLFIPQP